MASTANKRQLKVEVVAYKRQRILEEGSRLFFTRGYEASTLDMLADRLHVTKPFLYSYYRSKGEILSAICETGIRETLEAMEAARETPASPRDMLAKMVAGSARVVIERQEYIVVYQREMKNLERDDARRILNLRRDFDHLIANVVEDGESRSQFKVADPGLAAVWIGGLLSWIPNWYVPGGSRSADEVVDHVVDASMRLVGAQLLPPPATAPAI